MIAPPPSTQTDRLAELESYRVLDTEPEQGFDDVVALAARICETPVALISLVDRDRQWFKARFGFEADQTPLEQSICSHAILNEGILEIEDTWLDARTVDNPLCVTMQEPIRFYAGAPLVTESGLKLGTLCVLDVTPRKLNALQHETLRVLAGQVMRQLQLGRALQTETVLRDEIDHRVKNSLQTVTSFIRLYSSRAKLPETKDALAAIRRRVDAIVQLHSELYQTHEFDMIRLDRYLDRVVRLLQGTAGANIRIETGDRAGQHGFTQGGDARDDRQRILRQFGQARLSLRAGGPDQGRSQPTGQGAMLLVCRTTAWAPPMFRRLPSTRW